MHTLVRGGGQHGSFDALDYQKIKQGGTPSKLGGSVHGHIHKDGELATNKVDAVAGVESRS